MDNKLEIQALELSFTILEDILMARPLTTKENVMAIADKALIEVKGAKEYPEVVKVAYDEAYKKLSDLTFKEIKEIREMLED